MRLMQMLLQETAVKIGKNCHKNVGKCRKNQ
jgi:hypothetical protein